jgi:hypothetical protein
MKKTILILFALSGFSLLAPLAAKAQSIADLTQQLVIDLNKLAQFKSTLTSLKKGYQVVSKGYGTIKDISKGNFDLHKAFLDGLMAVSPEVRKYHKIPEIINYQIALVREQKKALQRFRSSGNFSQGEIGYLSRVYENLVNESLKNLDELITVTTANQLRMSDDERLKAIDRIHGSMQEKIIFLKGFDQDNGLISLQREREKFADQTVASLHGIKN